MSVEFLKAHAQALREFARETALLAAAEPDNYWLNLAAENQRHAAEYAERELRAARTGSARELFNF